MWTIMNIAECLEKQQALPVELHELICGHLPLVNIILSKLKRTLPENADFEELYSVGVLGLVDAALKFKEDRGFAFDTFASFRVRGAIQDALRRMDHLTRTGRKKVKTIASAETALGQELGREPTELELANRLKISVNQLGKMRAELEGRYTFSLSQTVGEDQGGWENIIADEHNICANDALEDKETREHLLEELQLMPYKERMVLQLYYFDGLKLNQIATELNLTEARVSQIRVTALKRLAENLKSN